MALTPETMRTDPQGNTFDSGAMLSDITRMDQDQLGAYVRATFLGKRDLKFLPGPFWDTYYDPHSLGTPDGRGAPSAPDLFANIYVSAGKRQSRGETTISVRSGKDTLEYPIDFNYRGRLRQTLREISHFASQPETTTEKLRLGLFAYETVDAIVLQDGPNSIVEQFSAQLEQKQEMNMGEVTEAIKGLQPHTPSEMEDLVEQARKLMDIPLFASTHSKIHQVYGNLYQVPELMPKG